MDTIELAQFNLLAGLVDSGRSDEVLVFLTLPDNLSATLRFRDFLVGAIREKRGEFALALRGYENAIDKDYKANEARLGTIRCLIALGRNAKANSICKTAERETWPEDALLRQLFTVQMHLKRFDPALGTAIMLSSLGLGAAHELSQLAFSLACRCEWQHRDQILNLLVDQITQTHQCVLDMFVLLSQIDEPEQHQEAAQCVARAIKRHGANFKRPQEPAPRKTAEHRRIKIGYLGGNLNHHATTLALAGVLEAHDRSNFEIIAFDYSAEDGTSSRSRMVNAFDVFVRLDSTGPEENARTIASMGVDILVDLQGYTARTRTELLALRPASIQVNFLGYVGTQGCDWCDYVIADRHVLPISESGHWNERVVHLPNCYFPNDRTRPTPLARAESSGRQHHGLPDDVFVFACFNSPYKITPSVFSIWMQILRETTSSVLWLLEGDPLGAINLRSEAERAGVSANRLVFAPRASIDFHINRHAEADLFLDTFPYNAHTTAADALWSGLPILTRPGKSFASRVCSSMLLQMGLDELVCRSDGDYFEKAIRLASDRSQLHGFQKVITEGREVSSLFDASLYASNLERAFTEMQSIHLNGLPPRHIIV